MVTPLFIFLISKGDMTMIAYAKFNEFITVGYFINKPK